MPLLVVCLQIATGPSVDWHSRSLKQGSPTRLTVGDMQMPPLQTWPGWHVMQDEPLDPQNRLLVLASDTQIRPKSMA